MKSASLFSGFGGDLIGAKMAGYDIAWGIELDDAIAQVARDNGLPVVTADVLDCNPADFERVEHLHASPPCPSFSVAKAGAKETAQDIALADKVAEFITVLKPRTVTIENVPAYRKSKSYQRILKAITDAGYMYDATIVNAADMGVPQTRRRLIVRAVLGGLIPPLPSRTRRIGWYEAIEDLIPTLPESHFADWQLARLPENMTTKLVSSNVSLKSIDEVAQFDPEQPSFSVIGSSPYVKAFLVHRSEKRSRIERAATQPSHTVMALSSGTSRQTGGMPRAFLMPNANSSSGVNRNGDEPSPTVGNINRVGNQPRAFIVDGKPKDYAGELQVMDGESPTVTVTSSQTRHPFRAWLSEGRVVKMTPRALARFQSFPDWYMLPDKAGLACKGIGNAVPCLMMSGILSGLSREPKRIEAEGVKVLTSLADM